MLALLRATKTTTCSLFFAAHKDVQQVVREDDHLLEVVVAVVPEAARFLEHALDGDDVGPLKEVGGGGRDEVGDFARVGVHRLDGEEHAVVIST